MIFNIIFSYPPNLAGQPGFLKVIGDAYTLLLADGTPYYPPNGCEYEIVDTIDTREAKVIDTTQEGLRRIQGYMPGLVSLYVLEPLRELWLSIAPAARTPTATMTSVINIYAYARDKIIWLRNTATLAQVDAYDPATDTGWPP